ncbi:hypothetical protein JCM10908_003282 [Rhodotorula pacifica]|uniref:uncharacterized protein n=1 Tax=Rhodotorula pacifica TaxID=1495444 RepID=UPI00317E3B73
MFGSTFLSGCSLLLSSIEALLVSPASSASASSPARDFYRRTAPPTTPTKRPSTPEAVPVVIVEGEEDDSPACPSSPTVSDSSSVCSQSSSDLFDSSSDESSTDEEDVDASELSRSNAFDLKVAALDFWLLRSKLANAAALASARSYGLGLIESEESYELRYDLSHECVKSSDLIESNESRIERITERLWRAMDDFAAQQAKADHLCRVQEAACTVPYTFVARPYSWPVQSHPRRLPTLAVSDSAAIDLTSTRALLARGSSSRRVSKPKKSSSGRSKVKSDGLLGATLDSGIRPAYLAYKRQELQAQAKARIASVSVPTGCETSCTSTSQRRGPRKVASVQYAGIENSPASGKSSRSALGLGRAPSAPAAGRPQMPIAAPRAGPAPARRAAKKSYGDIEPRRAPFRV